MRNGKTLKMNKNKLAVLESLVKKQKKINQMMNEKYVARLNIKNALKDIITPKEELKAVDPTRIEIAKNISDLKTQRHNQLLNILKPHTTITDVGNDMEPPEYKDVANIDPRTGKAKVYKNIFTDAENVDNYIEQTCVEKDTYFGISELDYDEKVILFIKLVLN